MTPEESIKQHSSLWAWLIEEEVETTKTWNGIRLISKSYVLEIRKSVAQGYTHIDFRLSDRLTGKCHSWWHSLPYWRIEMNPKKRDKFYQRYYGMKTSWSNWREA